MTDLVKQGVLRSRGFGLAVGMLVVVAAGAASLEENQARFLQSSLVARRELAESLKRFDHDFSDQQQKELRALDDRINALPPSDRAAYLGVLRTFHNWVATLPERARDDLLAKPPEARMAAVKGLIARYPLPSIESRSPVDFFQTGGTGVFELASLCKSWLSLSPEERRKLDARAEVGRRVELHHLGRARNIPIELKPADFDESHWISRVEDRLKELRASGAPHRDWISKLENKISEAAAKQKDDGKERRRPFLHRLAVNLYVQEHAPPPQVDADRLASFFQAIPTWVQSTFNGFPSDEARRRLTLIYRLVYPAPQEFDPRVLTKQPAARGAPATHPATPPRLAPPAPPSPAPGKKSKPETPF